MKAYYLENNNLGLSLPAIWWNDCIDKKIRKSWQHEWI